MELRARIEFEKSFANSRDSFQVFVPCLAAMKMQTRHLKSHATLHNSLWQFRKSRFRRSHAKSNQ